MPPLASAARPPARTVLAGVGCDTFVVVVAMNPCPCGDHGDPRRSCMCGAGAVSRDQQESTAVQTETANRRLSAGVQSGHAPQLGRSRTASSRAESRYPRRAGVRLAGAIRFRCAGMSSRGEASEAQAEAWRAASCPSGSWERMRLRRSDDPRARSLTVPEAVGIVWPQPLPTAPPAIPTVQTPVRRDVHARAPA